MSEILRVHKPEIVRRGEGFVLTAEFTLRGAPERVEISVERWPDSPDPAWAAQAAVALALPVAMAVGVAVEVDFPLSPMMLPALQDIQEFLAAWNEELSVVELRAEVMPDPLSLPANGRCAAFFTGGVDSFFTLGEHIEEIDCAVFVHGFDIALEDTALREQTSEHLRQATAALGVELVEVVTDVREFCDRFCYWGGHYCGAALAAVAHVFGGGFGRVYIPATTSLADLSGFGTHPMLDPKWSTEAVCIVHDGIETRRIDKIRALPDVALQHLRVCWENRDGKYNCGRCEKCLRTLANLRALGMTDRCSTFDRALDLAALAALELEHPLFEIFMVETLEEARARGDDDLAAAVSEVLAYFYGTRLRREMSECGTALYTVSNFDKLARRVRDRVFEDAWADDPEWVVKEIGKMLPEHRDALFEVFWERERKWLLGRSIKERLMRSFGRLLPGGRKGDSE